MNELGCMVVETEVEMCPMRHATDYCSTLAPAASSVVGPAPPGFGPSPPSHASAGPSLPDDKKKDPSAIGVIGPVMPSRPTGPHAASEDNVSARPAGFGPTLPPGFASATASADADSKSSDDEDADGSAGGGGFGPSLPPGFKKKSSVAGPPPPPEDDAKEGEKKEAPRRVAGPARPPQQLIDFVAAAMASLGIDLVLKPRHDA